MENFKLQSGLELDVFLPKEKLALEYQGEHHFYDIYPFGNNWIQKQRDNEKKKACAIEGIKLIEVPYWWDFKVTSLAATISQQAPHLLEALGNQIPNSPPLGFPTTGELS